jgi:hypothetical protein
MKWQGRAGSGNIEDRRGMGMALPVGGGIGGLVLLLLFSALTGTNPIDMINTSEPDSGAVGTTGVRDSDPEAEFIPVVLKDTEDIWAQIRDLDQRFGAPGDFAQAYVVAHEVGHHIQTITGISQRVHNAQRGGGDRRRPPAAAGAGPRRPRVVHPRHVGAARLLAAPRDGERPGRGVRYV